MAMAVHSSTKFTGSMVKVQLHYSVGKTGCAGKSRLSRKARASLLNLAVDFEGSLKDTR
jgi:hypothetical protein